MNFFKTNSEARNKMCSGMNQGRFQKIHEDAIQFVRKHSMDQLGSVHKKTEGGAEKK